MKRLNLSAWAVSHPRMLAMYLARKHTGAAYSEIGRYFGGRNHSTVISAEKKVLEWLKAEEGALNRRYEKELMNPKEGLALGSISSLVMPTDLRKVLGESIRFFLRHYKPSPMGGPQREFH